MRRQLNCAYLAQYLLTLIVIAILVWMAWRGAPPYAFVLAFLVGIILAALPGIYSGYVLPRREYRRAQSVLLNGKPSQARVLQDGVDVMADFQRSTVGYKGVGLVLTVQISLLPHETRSTAANMKAIGKDALVELKSGMLVNVRIDPDDQEYIVLDEIIGS